MATTGCEFSEKFGVFLVKLIYYLGKLPSGPVERNHTKDLGCPEDNCV